jgi:hypothetical protein
MFNSYSSYDSTDTTDQTDKSDISEDTDSDTSSASDYDNSEAYQLAKQDLITQLIEPVNGTNLDFYSDDYFEFVKMNDSFEIIFLRIIHLLFGSISDGIINFTNLKLYMDLDNDECSDLLNFFIENPGIMSDSNFYQSMTGLSLRNKWATLLSHRKFFSYEKTNWEVKPCLNNFYEFVKNFFPEVGLDSNENKHHQTLINHIYSRLNFNYEKLDVIWELINFENSNKSIQYIYINGFDVYSWSIIETKVLNENTNDITIKYTSELLLI